MLTFFANVRTQVQDFLSARLETNGMKWYLSDQVELMKATPDGQQTTLPHFRSKTYTSLNLITLDERKFSKYVPEFWKVYSRIIWMGAQNVVSLIAHTVIYSPIKGSTKPLEY